MPLDETFIKKAIQAEVYELSLHADEERLHDHLSITELEAVLLSCEILERYPEDPRGESCLHWDSAENDRSISCAEKPGKTSCS